jgi:channel protein (hemolysin III family)
MKHLDQSMNFVLIAAPTRWSPLVGLRPAWGITLLALTLTVAAVCVLVYVLCLERWHRVGLAMLGWLVIVVAPQPLHSLTRVALTLLVICGVPYTVGAIVLARKPSHPQPTVFGYHVRHTSSSAPTPARTRS